MQPIRRIAVVLTAILLIAPEALAADCTALMARIDAYDRELGKAIHDEPEDLPKELQRYSKALESGDTAQADRIQRRIRTGYVEIQMIDPPPEAKRLHADMIEYYRDGVAVLDAQDSGDHQARHAAELETWIGLKKFFTNLRDFLAEHDCNPGDVEAIDERYLPELEKHIETMRMGGPAPAHY